MILEISALVISILTAIFLFLQFRYQNKPTLNIKLISGDKKIIEKPNLLETDRLFLKNIKENKFASSMSLYLIIENKSNFVADNVILQCKDSLNTKYDKIYIKYINPGETVRLIAPFYQLNKQKELFTEYEETRRNFSKIPKKELIFNFYLILKHNPLFWLFAFKIRDEYKIEWRSLNELKDIKQHPNIVSTHLRSDKSVYYN